MGHRRHEAHDQADAAEVVELHRALEVVEAVVAGLDRTPDRTPGVVDEHIDVAVLVEHLLHQPVAVGHVRQVRRVGEYLAAGRLHLVARLEQLLLRSEEHTSELQSLMRISYAASCLQKKKKPQRTSYEI